MKTALLRAVSAAERLRAWLLDQAWFHSALLPALPREIRWFLRKAYLTPVDVADRVLGRDSGGPPKAGNFSGDGELHNLKARGEIFVECLRSAADLGPSSRLLDVGCGVGRLALAMPQFLNADGSYEGLDIVPQGIDWCKKNITSPRNNVHFTLADVYNKEYNPKGRTRATDYIFPYEDEIFDVVVLISVFTHMVPAEFEHYVSEIARVLKSKGRIFATFHLMTPESLKMMRTSGCNTQFRYNLGHYWVQSKKVPELAVAYDECYVRDVYAKHGFSDPPTIYAGDWSGRQSYWVGRSVLSGQDSVVGIKL